MKRKVLLKVLDISLNEFRTMMSRATIKTRGGGYAHEYSEEEIGRFRRVVEAKKELEMAYEGLENGSTQTTGRIIETKRHEDCRTGMPS